MLGIWDIVMVETESINRSISTFFYVFDTLEVICVSFFGIVLEENLTGIHDENLKKRYIV